MCSSSFKITKKTITEPIVEIKMCFATKPEIIDDKPKSLREVHTFQKEIKEENRTVRTVIPLKISFKRNKNGMYEIFLGAKSSKDPGLLG